MMTEARIRRIPPSSVGGARPMWVWHTRPTNAAVKPIPSSVSDMSNVAGVFKGDVRHSRYGGSETIFCKIFFR